jgi:hypothetical protein
MSLNALEFENKNSRPWMSQGICKAWKSLNSSCFSLCLYGYFLELFDIQKRTFCWIDFHVHIWQSCLKLIKFFMNFYIRFEQFNVTFYWFLTPSLRYLVLEFADTWLWMSLKSPWIWLSDMYEPWLTLTEPWLTLTYSKHQKRKLLYWSEEIFASL